MLRRDQQYLIVVIPTPSEVEAEESASRLVPGSGEPPRGELAASVAAQTAREVNGVAAVEPLQNETPAKIIIDPPLAELLSHGQVAIQYRAQNLHIVPVFGPAALAVSSRVGRIHVTVDDAPWVWADAIGFDEDNLGISTINKFGYDLLIE